MGIDIGIFLSGLNRAETILNRINQNIANINTTSYNAVNSLTGGIDFSLSAMMFTGDSFDFALAGDGFFRVFDGEENALYTRNGHFSLNSSTKTILDSPTHSPQHSPRPRFLQMTVPYLAIQRHHLRIRQEYH